MPARTVIQYEQASERSESMAADFYRSFDEIPVVLSAKDLSKVLCVSEPHAYRMMHSDDFPTIMIGKRLMVMKNSLIEWLSHKEAKGA